MTLSLWLYARINAIFVILCQNLMYVYGYVAELVLSLWWCIKFWNTTTKIALIFWNITTKIVLIPLVFFLNFRFHRTSHHILWWKSLKKFAKVWRNWQKLWYLLFCNFCVFLWMLEFLPIYSSFCFFLSALLPQLDINHHV